MLKLPSYINVLNPENIPCIGQALQLGTCNEFGRALEVIEDDKSVSAEFVRGCLSLNAGHKEEALCSFRAVIRDPEGHFLAPALSDYITATTREAAKMYGGNEFSKYFQAAVNTPVFTRSHRIVNNTMLSMPPLGEDTFIIVDIGIGTAIQIEKMVACIAREWPWMRHVKVIGIEPYEEMMKIASEKLRLLSAHANGHLSISYKLIEEFAQNLDGSFLRPLLDGKRPHLVNASASMHHMPKADKIKLMKTIREWQPKMFIVNDADSEHDIDLPDLSITLIANVTSFYNELFAYMASGTHDASLLQLYKGFVFLDARNIIAETGDKRIEFHTSAGNWVQYANQAGFKIVKPKSEWIAGIPSEFVRETEDYIVTAYYKRPLTFQLVLET
ncbi:MAG: hypothetical protein HQM16_07545 [Deltaproteobacteria bacterium]|nr:hypothetical protein [Deltaproteobacteria bacterium]